MSRHFPGASSQVPRGRPPVRWSFLIFVEKVLTHLPGLRQAEDRVQAEHPGAVRRRAP
jgi:hypothetical protein